MVLMCIAAHALLITDIKAQETEDVPESALGTAQQESERITVTVQPLAARLTFEIPYLTVDLIPHATAGTEAQALGIHATAHITLPEFFITDNIYFFLQAAYFYSFDNLGIPEPSHTGFFSGAVGLSVGEYGTLQNNFIPIGKRRHTILFQYEYFLDSINTSQALGTIAYYYSQSNWLVGFQFENDYLAFLGFDRFRTSGVEITSLFKTNGHTWGVGVGNIIWTGTTEGTDRTGDRGMSVDVSGNLGGEYTHGILYVAGYYDSFKLSVGVDAEEIRSAFQNTFHFLINQSLIATVPNDGPRFYIQLQINPRYSLF